MKIDELIKELQKIRSSQGNIDVELSVYYEWEGNEVSSNTIEVLFYEGNEEEMVSSYVELYGICKWEDSEY